MKCNICGKQFDKKKSLSNHYRWCSKDIKYSNFKKSYKQKVSYYMKNNNPVRSEDVKEKISKTMIDKYKEGNIISPFSLKEVQQKLKPERTERMKKNNPMFNELTVKKVVETRKKMFEEGILVSHFKDRDIYNEKNPNWKGGISRLPYGPEWGPKLKKEILKRDNYTCQLCGIKIEIQTRRKFITIHHINHDKTDNAKINLITLCNSCNCIVNKLREEWVNYFTIILERRGVV